jgi:hypothetical protein
MVIAMAGSSGPQVEFARVLDTAQAAQASTAMFLPFVLGNLVGILLVGVALLRSDGPGLGGGRDSALAAAAHDRARRRQRMVRGDRRVAAGVGIAATGMTLLAPRSTHRGLLELETGSLTSGDR